MLQRPIHRTRGTPGRLTRYRWPRFTLRCVRCVLIIEARPTQFCEAPEIPPGGRDRAPGDADGFPAGASGLASSLHGAAKQMENSTDRVPTGGFAPLVPELDVFDLAASKHFWCDILGFQIAYQRAENGFVYLELQG